MPTIDDAVAEYAVTHFLHLIDGSRRQNDSRLLSTGKPDARWWWSINEFIFFEPPAQPNSKLLSANLENYASLKNVSESTTNLADVVQRDGAVLLKWYGLRDTFDGYLRERLTAWAKFCHLCIERERWVAPNWAELWLVADGQPSWVETIEDAERLIAVLIELHGGAAATVTLTPREVRTYGHSRIAPAAPTRETPWFSLETASLQIAFPGANAGVPRVHPPRTPRLVQFISETSR